MSKEAQHIDDIIEYLQNNSGGITPATASTQEKISQYSPEIIAMAIEKLTEFKNADTDAEKSRALAETDMILGGASGVHYATNLESYQAIAKEYGEKSPSQSTLQNSLPDLSEANYTGDPTLPAEVAAAGVAVPASLITPDVKQYDQQHTAAPVTPASSY